MRTDFFGRPYLKFLACTAACCSLLGACAGDDGTAKSDASADSRATARQHGETLDFSIRDGQILNRFFREGRVSAHIVLTSGNRPRLVVAFPAGNSGVSLWFDPPASAATWHDVDALRAVSDRTPDGESLYGIQSDITVDAPALAVDQAVLGSVRVIRDFMHTRTLPDSVRSMPIVEGRSAIWYRDRIDGLGGYKLAIEVLAGSIEGGAGKPVIFTPPPGQPLRLRIAALTGDKPLTPIDVGAVVTDAANDDELATNVLAYLSYDEKLLAGSWRFCTYFGRDTLLSLRLLMPVLTPRAIEAGLASVLTRLNANGEVAHEEDIGEFAILRRAASRQSTNDEALYDYKMVDDDFLLAPVAAHYLLNHAEGRARAPTFLRLPASNGQTHGDALVRNFRFVLSSARQFGLDPSIGNLIALKRGEHAGNWRDSEEGLGNGRIPYDVNAILVPAALSGIARLRSSGLLDDYVARPDELSGAEALAAVWHRHAPPLFAVSVPKEEAHRSITEFAAAANIPDGDALASLGNDVDGGNADVMFHAVALDEQGRTVPVVNSDYGFALLFGDPAAAELQRVVSALMRPFPAGLLTPVGLVVANPVYASQQQRQMFTNSHYHGAVIWSWQQALLAAGFARQLERNELPAATRTVLTDAQARLWQVINATNSVRNSELWSWSVEENEYRVELFGQRSEDRTESNAAQLWSTVYLAIGAP